MDITVEATTVAALSNADYRKVRRICMKPWGGCMRNDIDYMRGIGDRQSMVIMVKDPTQRVLAWSLIDLQGKVPYVQFWTRTRERRKGYGRLLAERVKELVGDTFRHYRAPENKGFWEALSIKSKHNFSYLPDDLYR
jgi:hypothetical protein